MKKILFIRFLPFLSFFILFQTMLLGNKKEQKEEQNWCVVLQPLQSELSKIRLSQRLSGAFELALDEATDVVNSTPIIILDNLTHSVADRIKTFFAETGAEMVLTNDLIQKRKYYRTVWPEKPSLSFLHDLQPSQVEKPTVGKGNEHAPLATDEALQEIRSITNKSSKSPAAKKESTIPTSNPIKQNGKKPDQHLQIELNERRRECATLREEISRLKLDLEKKEKQSRQVAPVEKISETEKDFQKKEKELRALASNAEERYEVLKEEYREARSLFEEKLLKSKKQAEDWKVKFDRLEASTQSLEGEKNMASESLLEKERACVELQKQLKGLEAEIEKKAAEVTQETRLWQAKYEQEKAQQKNLFEKVEVLENSLQTQKLHNDQLKADHDKMTQQIDLLKKDYDQAKDQKKVAEERYKELEKSQLRLIEDFETRSRDARELEARVEELDKQLAEATEALETNEKISRMNLNQLEVREKELQTAKHDIKDLEQRLHDREAYYRRLLVDNRLAEKEARLKRLIREQQRMEKEVREREETIRELLVEQSDLEKEIMEDRQVDIGAADVPRSSTARLKIEKGEEPEPLENPPAQDSQDLES